MVVVRAYYFVVLLVGSRRLALGADNSTSEIPEKEHRGIIEYQDWEYNVTRTIKLNASPLYKALTKDTNKYKLYTKGNLDPQDLYKNSLASITVSSYNRADQTVIIVHGWNGNWNSKLNPTIRDAFLGVIYANIIVVDWSTVASRDYMTATISVPRVGRFLGQFLQFLNIKAGASYSTMHLVGFGLGAHVVGNAAKYLQPTGRVARITGLNPAGLLNWGNNTKRLKAGDAVYVEAIHTDGGLLGTTSRSGDVDFYPNGGTSQPGCSSKILNSCSHMRSWQLFAATVKFNHLVGRRCATDGALGLNMCFHDYLPMGNDDLIKSARGVYRLSTCGKYPYSQIF